MNPLGDSNVLAFLRMLRVGEGTDDANGYRRLFGGELFDSFADHPRRAITRSLGGKPITSTAAGAYQALARTWDDFIRACGPHDFSPASQDAFAVWCVDRRKALADVIGGRIEQAIGKCNREWASLPGSPYGQPTVTMGAALDNFVRFGGELAPDAPAQPVQPREEKMAPFIAAALPALVEAVPALINVFGGGTPNAVRNEKAATIAVEAAKQAIGARNEQELVEQIKSGDPQVVEAVRDGVKAAWHDISEAGGGGIEGARRADAAMAADKDASLRRSPSFLVALLLLPLVYMIVASLVGLIGTASWSDDVRAGLSGSIVSAIIGGLVGYYYGQITSRNRAA